MEVDEAPPGSAAIPRRARRNPVGRRARRREPVRGGGPPC